jgi:phytoene desaturase
MTKKIAVIGGGFSGLSTASYLAKAGYEVTLFEKNSTVGGRNRKFSEEGFTFEMGPSW